MMMMMMMMTASNINLIALNSKSLAANHLTLLIGNLLMFIVCM